MAEDLKKFLLYFRSIDSDIRVTPSQPKLGDPEGPLGEYEIDLVPKLSDGHFDQHDVNGLPVRLDKAGLPIHNYTTLCSFALGHWQKFLRTGNTESRQVVYAVSDYIVRTAVRHDSMLLLRDEIGGKGHLGAPSAMCSGEAISVLCRAWQTSRENTYLQTARSLLDAFEVPVEDDGVMGVVEPGNVHWYEEYPGNPLYPHVLNGMIAALWGLRDLFVLNADARAKKLFDAGVDSIARALPRFDTGYWSLYSLAGSRGAYLASMKYHAVHITQLRILAAQTGRAELQATADRFVGYARNPLNRIHAAAAFAGAKIKYKFRG